MMQRIKDMLICFMTKRYGIKSVLTLLSLLFCLFAQPKSAYPNCDGYVFSLGIWPVQGCFSFVYDCGSEAEAQDVVSYFNSLGFSFAESDLPGRLCEGACYVAILNACTGGSVCWYECNVVKPPPPDPNICGTGSGSAAAGL